MNLCDYAWKWDVWKSFFVSFGVNEITPFVFKVHALFVYEDLLIFPHRLLQLESVPYTTKVLEGYVVLISKFA